MTLTSFLILCLYWHSVCVVRDCPWDVVKPDQLADCERKRAVVPGGGGGWRNLIYRVS
jgi:hypothetical protein